MPLHKSTSKHMHQTQGVPTGIITPERGVDLPLPVPDVRELLPIEAHAALAL